MELYLHFPMHHRYNFTFPSRWNVTWQWICASAWYSRATASHEWGDVAGICPIQQRSEPHFPSCLIRLQRMRARYWEACGFPSDRNRSSRVNKVCSSGYATPSLRRMRNFCEFPPICYLVICSCYFFSHNSKTNYLVENKGRVDKVDVAAKT
jgi:hypothetical protein